MRNGWYWYPRGKRERKYSLLARISIVDVYDALRSERPRKPISNEESLQITLNDKGKHFDPTQ